MTEFVYVNEAVTLPLLPPVLTAVKYMLNPAGEVRENELATNSCTNPGAPKVSRLAVSRGSWNVTKTVNSEPPKSSVPPPVEGGPFNGLFICSSDPVTDELSTFVVPSCAAVPACVRPGTPEKQA